MGHPYQDPLKPSSEETNLAPENSRRNSRFMGVVGLFYLLCLLAALTALFVKPKFFKELATGPQKPGKVSSFLPLAPTGDTIGVVRLDGIISLQRRGTILGDSIVDKTKRTLESMAKKNHVKAIILRINSPGGTVAGSQELYAAIRRLRQRHKKPVIALMADVAASGGYYVASACDRIVADAGTLTGSIGVIFQTGQFDGLLKKYGIAFNTIKSGKFKDIGSWSRPMKEEEKEILQNIIDRAYEQFVQAVAEGRQMSPLQVKRLADGRIYIAEEAQRLDLIDSTGGMDEAVSLAVQLGRIRGDPNLIWDWSLKEDLLAELLKSQTPRFLGLTWPLPEAAAPWAPEALIRPLPEAAEAANALGAIGTDPALSRPPSGLLYLWTGF